jgi:hypothetical protein
MLRIPISVNNNNVINKETFSSINSEIYANILHNFEIIKSVHFFVVKGTAADATDAPQP